MVRADSRITVVRLIALLGLTVGVAGCLAALEDDAGGATGPPPPAWFTGCSADSYDFIGEGTLAALRLDEATPVPPPEPNRPAMIWVTHDLLPHDRGAPGGDVEMTRMLCFEFDDGSGGSEWPVDAAWQAPGSEGRVADDDVARTSVPAIVAVALAALLIAAVSAVAFRRRGSDRS